MASSGLQLLGFSLALLGLAATVSATFMVEWKEQPRGDTDPIYEGLWMTCSGDERTTCESHESIFNLSVENQATRAVLLLCIFLSVVGLLMSTVGMKCTRFMDGQKQSKSCIALTGGIIFIITGLLNLIITSCFEFGKAVFVSWAGSLLSLLGGACLSCRRCTNGPESVTSNHLFPQSHPKSNYV